MYCSRCGTNNREGSKFCNNCGGTLTAPDVACPACGTVNPSKNAFCNNCGARLVPPAARPEKSTVAPIKGLSLPTKTPPSLPVEPPAPKGDGSGDKGLAEGAQGSADQDSGEAQPAPSPFGDEVPEWLAQLRAAPPVEEEATKARPVPEDIPSWIRQLQSIQPEEKPNPPAEKPSAPPAPVSAETPTWIRQLQTALPEESAPEPTAAEPEPPASPTEPAEAKPIEPEPTGLPAWLEEPSESAWLPKQEPTPPSAEVSAAQAAVEKQAPAAEEPLVAPPFAPTEELPPATPVESGSPFPIVTDDASTVDQSGLPDWLQDLHPKETPAGEAKATTETQAPGQESSAGLPDWLLAGTAPQQRPDLSELPEWLRMAMPAEKPADAPSEEPMVEPATGPAPAVPDTSVPVKPAEPQAPVAPGELEIEPLDAGTPLAGLRGVIPLAMAVAEPHMTVEKPVTSGVEKDDGARIFEAILTEAPTQVEAVSARRPARAMTMRPIIYLLLALAVIIPFFLPGSLAQSLLRISKTPAADLYDLIEAVPSNSTVLVAFDYDPGTAGEMNLLASAVIRHLMERRIKIIALSTYDTGPQIAQKILHDAAASVKDYRYGSEYVNFGYVPGHEVGLASLAVGGLSAAKGQAKDYDEGLDIKQYPMVQKIKSANDLQLIVELAGSEDPLRWWMEQVQPRTPTRIVAAVSAAVEPKARAYLRPGQLAGLVSGLIGAGQYEILSNQPGQALTTVNAQSAAQIVLILIVVLGNLVHWMSRAGTPSPRARPGKAT